MFLPVFGDARPYKATKIQGCGQSSIVVAIENQNGEKKVLRIRRLKTGRKDCFPLTNAHEWTDNSIRNHKSDYNDYDDHDQPQKSCAPDAPAQQWFIEKVLVPYGLRHYCEMPLVVPRIGDGIMDKIRSIMTSVAGQNGALLTPIKEGKQPIGLGLEPDALMMPNYCAGSLLGNQIADSTSYPLITIELKLKRSYRFIYPDSKSPTDRFCLFCIMQKYQTGRGKWKNATDYCAYKMFSGNRCSMTESLKALIREPHRHLRIFKNSDHVGREYWKQFITEEFVYPDDSEEGGLNGTGGYSNAGDYATANEINEMPENKRFPKYDQDGIRLPSVEQQEYDKAEHFFINILIDILTAKHDIPVASSFRSPICSRMPLKKLLKPLNSDVREGSSSCNNENSPSMTNGLLDNHSSEQSNQIGKCVRACPPISSAVTSSAIDSRAMNGGSSDDLAYNCCCASLGAEWNNCSIVESKGQESVLNVLDRLHRLDQIGPKGAELILMKNSDWLKDNGIATTLDLFRFVDQWSMSIDKSEDNELMNGKIEVGKLSGSDKLEPVINETKVDNDDRMPLENPTCKNGFIRAHFSRARDLLDSRYESEKQTEDERFIELQKLCAFFISKTMADCSVMISIQKSNYPESEGGDLEASKIDGYPGCKPSLSIIGPINGNYFAYRIALVDLDMKLLDRTAKWRCQEDEFCEFAKNSSPNSLKICMGNSSKVG